jgi:hypothetical protein
MAVHYILVAYDLTYVALSIAIMATNIGCVYSQLKLTLSVITILSSLITFIIYSHNPIILHIRTAITLIFGIPLLIYMVGDTNCHNSFSNLYIFSLLSYIFDAVSTGMHAIIIKLSMHAINADAPYTSV